MLTRATSYAVRALCQIARNGNGNGKNVPCRVLSAECDLPESFTVKVLQRLAHAGILNVVRGPGGGYNFRRAPESITLLELAEAIDGPMTLFGSQVPVSSEADTAIAEAELAVEGVLGGVTVAAMAGVER